MGGGRPGEQLCLVRRVRPLYLSTVEDVESAPRITPQVEGDAVAPGEPRRQFGGVTRQARVQRQRGRSVTDHLQRLGQDQVHPLVPDRPGPDRRHHVARPAGSRDLGASKIPVASLIVSESPAVVVS